MKCFADLQVSVEVKMNHLTEATTNAIIIDVIKNQVEIRHTEMIVGMIAGGMIEGMTVEVRVNILVQNVTTRWR